VEVEIKEEDVKEEALAPLVPPDNNWESEEEGKFEGGWEEKEGEEESERAGDEDGVGREREFVSVISGSFLCEPREPREEPLSAASEFIRIFGPFCS